MLFTKLMLGVALLGSAFTAFATEVHNINGCANIAGKPVCSFAIFTWHLGYINVPDGSAMIYTGFQGLKDSEGQYLQYEVPAFGQVISWDPKLPRVWLIHGCLHAGRSLKAPIVGNKCITQRNTNKVLSPYYETQFGKKKSAAKEGIEIAKAENTGLFTDQDTPYSTNSETGVDAPSWDDHENLAIPEDDWSQDFGINRREETRSGKTAKKARTST